MRLFKFFVTFGVVVTGLCGTLYAKDLTGRLGVGFINEFSNSTATRTVPAISLKYGISRDMHWLGALGFNTDSPAAFTAGTKFFKNIFYENNLNFYSTLGLAILKNERTGFEILGALGAEFFIPGVDSLGLSFETGVAATNVTGSFLVKTIGFTFLNAGMHFYF